MERKLKILSSALLLTALATNSSIAASPHQIPAIVVKKDKKTGRYEVPHNFPGSANYISPEQIEKRQSNDILRIIAEVPGINIQEEDGYGLRPNIGMRGSGNDRSANIALMEDGVLISPAPYAASSAYYFPSMGRVKGLEVRKGSSSIKYGPRTTAGALNLITTPIPSFGKGSFEGSVGNFDEKNFNFNYGDAGKNYGYVVNFDNKSSDGFKELDGGGDTGYNVSDFMAKFRVNTDKNADIYQALEFKVGMTDEVSHETYLGLALGDFNENPYRRYRASSLDEMNNEHRQYEIRHHIEPSKNFNVSTTAYYHEFARNWYKLNKVGGVNIASILDDVSTYSSEFDIMKGDANGALTIRANNRQYVSQGVQSVANNKFDLGKLENSLSYGVRYHVDHEDRFQNDDGYNMAGGNVSLSSIGTAGGAGNRIGSAKSVSGFVENEVALGKFTIVPGLRYEHIEMKRRDFGSDSLRAGVPTSYNSSDDVFIPGISSSYEVSESSVIYAGVHKGFSPSTVPNGTNNASIEESVNYEIGSRYKKGFLSTETVIFFNDYKNLLGEEVGSIGDQYNGGEVDVYGLEFSASYEGRGKLFDTAFNYPLRLSYTHNVAEFKSSFNSNLEEWGNVKKGDKLPYIAKHQFSLVAGFEVGKLSLSLSNKYVDEMRSTAGRGKIAKGDKIPSHFVTDFAGFYEFKDDQKVFLAVDNIFDREYAVALRPAGLRPGKPMTARVGIVIGF